MSGMELIVVVLLFILFSPAIAALSAFVVFGVASLLTNKDTDVLVLAFKERCARLSSSPKRRIDLLESRLQQLEEYERELIREIRHFPIGNPNHALTEGYIDQVHAMMGATREELYQARLKRVEGGIRKMIGDRS
ncbi:MAG: hypothetical protein ACR2GU_08575 [Rubrobacteraceae bacterium]